MPPTDRIFALYLGCQASGKTFRLRQRATMIAREAGRVGSVWILDVTGEWTANPPPGAIVVGSVPGYLQECRDTLPRMLIWSRAGESVSSDLILSEAAAQGDIALVADEAYHWMPAGPTMDPTWKRVVLQGRHLPNIEGELRPLHVLLATQYSRSVNHLVLGQANEIWTGRLVGERDLQWVAGHFGNDAAAKARALEGHRFIRLR